MLANHLNIWRPSRFDGRMWCSSIEAGGTACPTKKNQELAVRWDRRFRLLKVFQQSLISCAKKGRLTTGLQDAILPHTVGNDVRSFVPVRDFGQLGPASGHGR